MNDVAHTDKKGIDLNEDGEVLATVANMEEIQSRHESPRRVITWSRSTGEQFSANPGDYFAAESGEALVDGLGEDMLLAYVTPERVAPIKLDGDCDHCHGGWELIDTRELGLPNSPGSDTQNLYSPCQHCAAGDRACDLVANS